GDKEDLQGHPFVGPAGRVLDRGMERAGISTSDAYITNVVKHFRYKARGKRRIHQRPDRWQVTACLPWLDAELAMVRPSAVVLLGATAAQALLVSAGLADPCVGITLPSAMNRFGIPHARWSESTTLCSGSVPILQPPTRCA